jgi:ubiquinone/menaquinone biosynthesis C-methylase UbiE
MNDWRRYDTVAETYERVRAPVTAAVAADLVALAAPATGAKVLDVGSGTGVAADAAASAIPAGLVVGADMSVEMLRVATRARPGLRLIAAEAIQLPFRDGTFDAVLANFVLHEFTRYDTALFDLIRVLRPGGTLAASVWRTEEDELSRTWRTLVEQTIGKEMLRSTLRDATPWAERFGDPARFEDTLRHSGLRPVRVERRSYRFTMTRDDYVEDQSTRALGRFVRGMLGEGGWTSFLERARSAFASGFGQNVEDSRDVLLAVGTKP